MTGALADGNGTAVSESPSTPGVSNVRFDPALAAPPSTGPDAANATATASDADADANAD